MHDQTFLIILILGGDQAEMNKLLQGYIKEVEDLRCAKTAYQY